MRGSGAGCPGVTPLIPTIVLSTVTCGGPRRAAPHRTAGPGLAAGLLQSVLESSAVPSRPFPSRPRRGIP